jgi:hypothetical protein
MSSIAIHPKDSSPETWPRVAAGLAIFLVAGLMLILAELPLEVRSPEWALKLRNLSHWGMLLVPPAGFALGWMWGFPRWSYPYVPLALFFALYIANASTPGLTFFGYPTFGRQLWGIRACIPLLLIGGIAWLATRSVKPFRRFFTQIGEDWTLGSYALSGTLPLVIFIAYDEIDRLYSLRDMIWLIALMLLMAAVYLRSRTPRLRGFTVGLGIPLILLYTAASVTLFWLSQGPNNVYIPGMLAWTMVLLYIYLSPGIIIGLTKKALKSNTEA